MADEIISPLGQTRFDGSHTPGLPGRGPTGERERPPRRLDQVELTEPRRAALRLLRERVLDVTRTKLELTRQSLSGIEFAPHPSDRADVYVGRLISDQNLLAAPRRESWPERRDTVALEEGMTQGLAETLEILNEIGELDSESWRLVCGVLEEFHRKVFAAGRGTLTDMDIGTPPEF